MSIEKLDKVTLVGHGSNKKAVLAGLQELGCLHLIPLKPEGKASDASGPSRDAREALRFLASASPRRRQASNAKDFDALRIEKQALELQHRHFDLLNQRDFISTRIDNLAAWGDFEFPTVERLGGNRLWFYPVPHHLMDDVAKTGLRWQLTHTSQRYC